MIAADLSMVAVVQADVTDTVETSLAETYLSEAEQLEAAADAPPEQSAEAEPQRLAADGAAAADAAAEQQQDSAQPADSPLDAVCHSEAAVAVELAAVLRKWENSNRGALILAVISLLVWHGIAALLRLRASTEISPAVSNMLLPP